MNHLESKSFEAVNGFVHNPDVEFEELQSACLDLATELEKYNIKKSDLNIAVNKFKRTGKKMNTEQKQMGICCKNDQCKFWDADFEQHCSAGDDWDNPHIIDCENYVPANQKADGGGRAVVEDVDYLVNQVDAETISLTRRR